jgi:hypothetical protein
MPGVSLIRSFIVTALLFASSLGLRAQDTGALPEVPLARLSDRSFTALGQAALGIRASEWKHAETANFVYHYFQSFVATPVSVEAEFYYRLIAQELGKESARWERKSHIFVFEKAEDWADFQKRGALDPWTGGIHSRGELFIRRDPAFKFKDNTLGHEVAHLVVDRFFGSNVPLWLNEGYAEYVSMRCYSAFHRARNYRSRPRSPAVVAAQFIPLAELTSAMAYPHDPVRIEAFYSESHRLVRFLSAADKTGFSGLFEALAKGARFDTALAKCFGGRFPGLEALEREFKGYATNDSGPSLPD